MSQTFEAKKNKEALLYTLITCIALLILFILISWTTVPPEEPIIKDQIEINLGNDAEGWGEEQPLVKGKRTSEKPEPNTNNTTGAPTENIKVNSEKNNNKDAAIVDNSSVKTNPKPRLTYPGTDNGKNGNNDADNGYSKDGIGDNGNPNGDKDSYGDTPGGDKGGPKLIKNDDGREIVSLDPHFFKSEDNLSLTVLAEIEVDKEGNGTFKKLVKKEDPATHKIIYPSAIEKYNKYKVEIEQKLKYVKFNKCTTCSISIVQMEFIFIAK